mgnify:CR=1 FL=1
MTTKKSTKKGRPDGRKPDQLREMNAQSGVVKRADGSAMFQSGKTIAYAAVYGPRSLHPRFLQNPEKGVLRCHYNMMSFSGSGDRVRPGPNRRSKEISMIIEKTFAPVIQLEQYPNCVIDIFIELLQTDAGTRCAGITAAAMALADAGIPMKDLIASVAVGLVNGEVVADLSYEEEAIEGTVDIPVAYMPRTKELTLLQLDGAISKENLKKALELGQKACATISALQTKALKEQYK